MSVLNAGTVVLAAESSESGGGFWEEAYPILPHPFELFTGLVVFSVLVFLAFKYAVPRFEAMYAERRSQIEGRIEEAEQAQAEADAALAEYREQLASARAEAGRLREEARTEGAQIIEEMRERAQAESARITESAQRQVVAERAQAVTQLRQEVGGLASALASKIVGESLEDHARQSRVIDRFLDELESGEVTASSAERSNGADGSGRSGEEVPAGVGAGSGGAEEAGSPASGASEGSTGSSRSGPGSSSSGLGKVLGKVLGHGDEQDR